jgi:hypothetical protein
VNVATSKKKPSERKVGPGKARKPAVAKKRVEPKAKNPASTKKTPAKIVKTVTNVAKAALGVAPAIIALLGLGPGAMKAVSALDKGLEIALSDDLFHPSHRNEDLHEVMKAILSRPDVQFVVNASHDGRLRQYLRVFGLPDNLKVLTPDP